MLQCRDDLAIFDYAHSARSVYAAMQLAALGSGQVAPNPMEGAVGSCY